MKTRLVRVLMVAAAVALISTSAAASTIVMPTMHFTTSDPFDFSKTGGGPNDFGVFLTFDNVVSDFDITVTADDNPSASLPPGYSCVPITGTNCILITLTPSAIGWSGDYTIEIRWNFGTGGSYPNTPVAPGGLGAIRILHFDSAGVLDITLPNSYCSTCGVDPGIGGRDDGFSGFEVTRFEAVPEPASMVLLGAGLVGLGLRLRRTRHPKN